MLAKLLPERHNLYGNSLDFKLNIYKKKMVNRKGWGLGLDSLSARLWMGWGSNVPILFNEAIKSMLCDI